MSTLLRCSVLLLLVAGCSNRGALEEQSETATLRADLAAAQAEVARLQAANASMDRQLRESMDAAVQNDDRGETVAELLAAELFGSGNSTLTASGQGRLDEVAARLRAEYPGRPLVVEGHSDAQPIRTPRYPSNWDLSTARASAVALYLQEAQDLDGARLRVVGYAEHDPVADNATADGRRQNRRVRIAALGG